MDSPNPNGCSCCNEAEQIISWLERQDRIGFAFATLIKRGEHRRAVRHLDTTVTPRYTPEP